MHKLFHGWKKTGSSSPEGKLLFKPLAYIQEKTPTCIIMENAPTLATMYQPQLRFIVQRLLKLDYKVECKLITTSDYGIPHERKRLYLLAVRSKRARPHIKHWFPPPIPCIKIQKLIKPAPSHRWAAMPDATLAKTNVKAALKKCAARGINPWKHCVIVDMHASTRFRTFKIDTSPTLCFRRCKSMGYWCTSKGAPLDEYDMMMLQGFDTSDIDFIGARVCPRTLAGCMGNALSANVISMLLPNLLLIANLITYEEFGSINDA